MINSKQAHSMKYGYDGELTQSEAWREVMQRAREGAPGRWNCRDPHEKERPEPTNPRGWATCLETQWLCRASLWFLSLSLEHQQTDWKQSADAIRIKVLGLAKVVTEARR